MILLESAVTYVEALAWPVFALIALGVAVATGAIAKLIEVPTPWGPIKLRPPASLKESGAVATGETAGAEPPAEAKAFFEVPPPLKVSGAVATGETAAEAPPPDTYLLHHARRAESRGRGKYWYEVRVWLEADRESILDACTRVTYKLHETFTPRLISTQQRKNEFELYLRVWGEFVIYALVERKDGSRMLLSRYLDLPGRPPD